MEGRVSPAAGSSKPEMFHRQEEMTQFPAVQVALVPIFHVVGSCKPRTNLDRARGARLLALAEPDGRCLTYRRQTHSKPLVESACRIRDRKHALNVQKEKAKQISPLVLHHSHEAPLS